MLKKAAMFGLDARIALAIFGALSVISGAALYSAIQNSKATALYTEMNELGKAVEAYWLDTGSLPARLENSNSALYQYDSFDLMSLQNNPGISGWNGPYYNFNDSNTVGSYVHPRDDRYGYFLVSYMNDKTNWGDNSNWTTNGRCAPADNCYIWIEFDQIKGGLASAKLLDEQYDSGNGPTAGSIKWLDYGDNSRVALYIRYMAIKHFNS
jgi:hypothetical protein